MKLHEVIAGTIIVVTFIVSLTISGHYNAQRDHELKLAQIAAGHEICK